MRYKKILLSFIFILVIILIYTIYKDKIIFKGTQNDFYKKYYYVFFVLISFPLRTCAVKASDNTV